MVFAGRVAADGLFVTVSHEQEIRTTYSFLSEITVSSGDRLTRGQVLGRSGDGHPGAGTASLHFGVRVRGEYVDPEAFFLDAPATIALVPLNEMPRAPPGIVRPATGSRPARSSREDAGSAQGAFVRSGDMITRTVGRLRQPTTGVLFGLAIAGVLFYLLRYRAAQPASSPTSIRRSSKAIGATRSPAPSSSTSPYPSGEGER
ncbi:MAG: peptidoglycan DD-metalloendopeptidase family protein [Actinomycetota bacterium]